jgi:NADH-quinone oxidoreductase subunit J
MLIVFYLAGAVTVLGVIVAITRPNAVHAVMSLVVALLALAGVLFLLGAPFVAALEVIIYAGAILVLFVFVIMLIGLGQEDVQRERRIQRPGLWVGPTLLGAALIVELVWLCLQAGGTTRTATVPPVQVGGALFGPYALAVEAASLVLLAGLVGAYHLGRRSAPSDEPGGGP